MKTQTLDTESLSDYLEQHIPGFKGRSARRKFDGGQSNPTFKTDAPTASTTCCGASHRVNY